MSAMSGRSSGRDALAGTCAAAPRRRRPGSRPGTRTLSWEALYSATCVERLAWSCRRAVPERSPRRAVGVVERVDRARRARVGSPVAVRPVGRSRRSRRRRPRPAARRAGSRRRALRAVGGCERVMGARWDAAGPQPLTAPAVRPRMSWRCRKMSRTRTGSAAMIAAAKPTLFWSTVLAESDLRPIWIVSHAPLGDDGAGPDVLVPGGEERDHGERGDDRPGHRDGDPPQEREVAEAVELRRRRAGRGGCRGSPGG